MSNEMTACLLSQSIFLSSSPSLPITIAKNYSSANPTFFLKPPLSLPSKLPRILSPIRATKVMEGEQSATNYSTIDPSIKLLFVEMGVGYDQHGQDITVAAMRACKDAISSNSIPAFRRGSIPGVSFEQMKLQIKLGVPRAVQQHLDIERVNGKILKVDVVDGGLICSSGVHVEEMGDKNDDCYIVNAAVYVGY